MEQDPFLTVTFHLGQIINPLQFADYLSIFIILILLVFSAIFSGSEVAYFSLSPVNIDNFKRKHTRINKQILALLDKPEKLLATILIANNLVNIGIVILSSLLANSIFDFSQSPILAFIIKIIAITFLLLLFGEIIPKVYAQRFASRFASFMAYPLMLLLHIFSPVSNLLMLTTKIFTNNSNRLKQNISVSDLSDALELTEKEITEEKKILEGIVRFGKVDVKEIMKSRVDVVAADSKNTRFKKLLSIITESGYSRIPIFEENLDKIIGILYIKDLLHYLNEDDNFKWQSLIRNPFFVPETKKIDDLLAEFQSSKIHMAIVVDEYGGTTGIVTLEDILEEIVGEITDESDELDQDYKQIDKNTYIFEGKTSLIDFLKVFDLKEGIFDDVRGDAESLAGLLLELKGEIPKRNEEIDYSDFLFKVEAVNNRRIVRIKVFYKKA